MRLPRIIHLDVTYRKADEMKELEEKVSALQRQVEKLEVDIHRFSLYAAENMRLYDDLRYAKRILDDNGLDSSFIQLRGLYRP